MSGKGLAEQMARLGNMDDQINQTIDPDLSNSLLNATCPARIQNVSNSSFSFGEDRVSRRVKKEPLRISPLEQIEENPRGRRSPSPLRRFNSKYPDSYKTRLCESFRRQGTCSYNECCPFAHGTNELRVPSRRKIYTRIESRSHLRDTSDDNMRVPSRRCMNDENRRPPIRDRMPPICKNFERGSCRYGPRCKYIHREQMQRYEPNASIYVPPESIPYYSGQCFVPAHTYFLPPQPHQYIPADLNQTMPIYAATTTTQQMMNVNGTYYFQPMAPTPVMEQAPTPQPLLMMQDPQQHMPHPEVQLPPLPDFRVPPPSMQPIM